MTADVLEKLNLPLIPQPQVVEPGEGYVHPKSLCLVVADTSDDEEDRFAAEVLADALKGEFGLRSTFAEAPSREATPVFFYRGEGLAAQGYRLTISREEIVIEGADAAGVYYGAQTLRQCFRRGPHGVGAPCLKITDRPDLTYRAIHYDTKHHQGTRDYVEAFIRELAHYKVNVLMWEWEDKFGYMKHPEIAAPGAFTKKEMQELTRFAKRHHVQIVPLVQGLGHVSYILKHPKHRKLREVADSNWEFCPLKEGSYKLLFDLFDEAMEATPGSEFLHIGSDETYELGEGKKCGCKAKADEIGKDGLMQIFIRRCVEHVEKRGRIALSWGGRWKADSDYAPPKSMIFVDSGHLDYLAAAKDAGYRVWVYAPNPGIEPLFLSYFPFIRRSVWQDSPGRERRGSFHDTAETISTAARAGSVNGSITTSWDDSGLHNQMWMPRFVCAGAYSWNADGPCVDRWTRVFFANYFGPEATDVRELFGLLQDCSQFWYDTFQRRVWHWGDVGKVTLPDLPRGDLEYSSHWKRRYAQMLNAARDERFRLDRARFIIDENLSRDVRRRYDFELMRSVTELMHHNAELILMLGEMEHAVGLASGAHFSDRKESLQQLNHAREMVEVNLAERKVVYSSLVKLWSRTRLKKGLSTKSKKYLHVRDRARHFANRTPDMSYLILDEQLLDLEGWLRKLKKIIAGYEKEMK